METYEFSAYGIRMRHPRDWNISFDRRRGFFPHDGFVKFEDARAGQQPEASLTLQWEDAGACIDFADKYYANVEKQFKKVFKKTDKYRLGKIEMTEANGHKACMVTGEYVAAAGLFGMTGKKEHLDNLQLAFQCDQTGRILVGNITAMHEYYLREAEPLQQLLFSLRCHD